MKITENLHYFLDEIDEDNLLLDFEVLKTDYYHEYQRINETLGKMAIIDLDKSLDMWEFILDANLRLINGDSGEFVDTMSYFITSGVIFELNQQSGFIDPLIPNAIKSRPKIKDAIFGKSACVDVNQCSIIAKYINQGDLDTANEVLQLVSANKNNKKLALGGIFKNVISIIGSDASFESIEFLYHLIQQIKDPKEKAKASVWLANLIIYTNSESEKESQILNNDQIKDILLNSFEELKDDVIENEDDSSYELANIVAKMFAFDEDTAILMWIYLLDRHKDFIPSSVGSIFCDFVIQDAEYEIGMPRLIEVIASNEIIKSSIFKLNGHIFIGTNDVLTESIASGEYSKANDFLELYSQNVNNKPYNGSLYELLLDAIEKVRENIQKDKREIEFIKRHSTSRKQSDQEKQFTKYIEDQIAFFSRWSKRVKKRKEAAEIREAIRNLNE